MRILILGSGAREHAIAWKLKQEIGEDNIYIAPGNAGTQMCGTNIDVNVSDFESLKKICLENNVDTVLPGSEEAIANGVRDYFEGNEDSKHIYVFSPDKHAGQLESSKAFAKEFMQKLSIPTAAYKSFTIDGIRGRLCFFR